MSQFFTSSHQSIGVSASTSVLQMNDWFHLLAVQGTLKSLQHHSSKASILWHSDFFIVQLSHPYMTTGKTIVWSRQAFGGKAISLLFNMLSRLVIAFLIENYLMLICQKGGWWSEKWWFPWHLKGNKWSTVRSHCPGAFTEGDQLWGLWLGSTLKRLCQ